MLHLGEVESDDLDAAAEAAESLGKVTNVISVGVDGESDDALLDAIASRPNLKVVSPSYNDIESVDTTIIDKFCSLL